MNTFIRFRDMADYSNFPGRQGLQCLSHALGHSPITYLTELRQRKFAIRLLNSSYSYQRRDTSSESICRIVCTYQGRIQEFALAVPLHCPPFSPSFPHSSSLPSPLLNSFILPSPPLPIRPPLNQLRAWERCKLPSGVQGGAPTENEFGAL